MVFQIEKNAAATCNDLADHVRTGGSKQLHADLEHSHRFAKSVAQFKRAIRVINIQSDD
jgi:hypothetical protein